MDKKVTRRAVLGMTVAALTVSPFLVYRWRKGRQEGVRHDLLYAPFDVESRRYLADVSQGQAKEAFDIFFRERESWLGFRKFSGNVALIQGNFSEKVEALLTFEWLPLDVQEGFPWMCKFTCSDPISKKLLWTYIANRGDGKEPFEGADVKKEFLRNLDAFMSPLITMYSLENVLLDEMFQTFFKVSFNPEAKDVPGSYAFMPVESEIDRGTLLTRNGRLYAIHPQHQGSPVGTRWEGFDWRSFGKLHFPSRVETSELIYKEDGSFDRKLLSTLVFDNFTVS